MERTRTVSISILILLFCIFTVLSHAVTSQIEKSEPRAKIRVVESCRLHVNLLRHNALQYALDRNEFSTDIGKVAGEKQR